MAVNKRKLRNAIEGYLFIAPNLIGFLVFIIFSVFFSLAISFTNWDMITPFSEIEFVGITNYIKLFSDRQFIAALSNNIFFLAFVPVSLIVALVVAAILNGEVFYSKTIRAILFLPYITNVVIVSLVWMFMLNSNTGIVNSFLMSIGITNPPKWLGSVIWVKPAILIMLNWQMLGYNTILYMAGLQAIPNELYEASYIDGAGKLKQFIHITVPLVSPTTFFMLIMNIINSFKMWSNVQILTDGGPGTASTVIGFYIYKTAFYNDDMGYASAMAWVLLLAVLAVTALQWRGQKKWVNYL